MYITTGAERKIREKLIYQYGSKSLFMQNCRPLFLAVSPAIVRRLIRN